MEELNIVFKFEKSTPGTYRYREDQDPATAVVGALYVRKWVFTDEPPDKISVTISEEEK